jgi:hypothetical protein
MIYCLYVSLIYIIAWYIYMGVLYLLGCFFSFLVTMNGGGLLQPHEPGFHPRAIPHYPDPSIVWNILSFVW